MTASMSSSSTKIHSRGSSTWPPVTDCCNSQSTWWIPKCVELLWKSLTKSCRTHGTINMFSSFSSAMVKGAMIICRALDVLPMDTCITILNVACYSGNWADVAPPPPRQELDGMFLLIAHHRQPSYHIVGIPDQGHIVVIVSPWLGLVTGNHNSPRWSTVSACFSYQGRIRFGSPRAFYKPAGNKCQVQGHGSHTNSPIL